MPATWEGWARHGVKWGDDKSGDETKQTELSCSGVGGNPSNLTRRMLYRLRKAMTERTFTTRAAIADFIGIDRRTTYNWDTTAREALLKGQGAKLSTHEENCILWDWLVTEHMQLTYREISIAIRNETNRLVKKSMSGEALELDEIATLERVRWASYDRVEADKIARLSDATEFSDGD